MWAWIFKGENMKSFKAKLFVCLLFLSSKVTPSCVELDSKFLESLDGVPVLGIDGNVVARMMNVVRNYTACNTVIKTKNKHS